MRRFIFVVGSLAGVLVATSMVPGCGGDDDGLGSSSGTSGGPDGSCVGFGCNQDNEGGKPGCQNLECRQVECTGGGTTSLTGKVYDPAGKVPLYNVFVYVPNSEPGPITTGLGATCDRCDGTITGTPIAQTTTDASGSFKLDNIPANVDFPLVMQIGKWRRKVTIPKATACTSVAAHVNLTRLPRNRSEGDIPRIALTTGSADPLECLLRKIGLEDSEFGLAGSEARVHLYTGGSSAPGVATSSFASGGSFTQAPALWGNLDELKKYDILMLSCEGGEIPNDKPDTARKALYDYATIGGRVFTSHYHHYWFSNSPVPEVKSIATWVNDFTNVASTIVPEPAKDVKVNATVNTAFPKGAAMKDSLKNTDSLKGPGDTLEILEARDNVDAVTSNALSWMTIQNPAAGANNRLAHEYMTFNTPVGAAEDKVCGRVVYSDLHVGAGDATGTPFPSGCTTPDLTPQQKALEFMLFDLSSCIQKDDQPVVLPK